MANWIENTVGFVGDPWGGGSSISRGLGKVLGTDNNAQVDSAQDTLAGIQARADQAGNYNNQLYGNYLKQMQDLYGSGNAAYGDAVKALTRAIDDRGDFEYTGNVNDFLDPNMRMRQDAAAKALNASASSGGSRFSSNYQDKLMAQSQGLAQEAWEKAYDRMMQDRANQLQAWQTGQNRVTNLANLANLYAQDRTQLGNALGDYYSAMANQNNANLEAYSDVASKNAELDAARTGGVGSLLGGAGSLVSSIFG